MGPASLRLGRSNLYLLDSGEGLILIDAGTPLRQAPRQAQDDAQGTARPDAWDVFTRWLAALGHRPEQVRALLLTHAHPDHLALAPALQRCGARVLIYGAEASALGGLSGREDRKATEDQMRRFLAQCGVPDDLAEDWTRVSPRRWRVASMEPDATLADGMELTWGDLRLRTVHCPGHSPGSTAFYDPETRALFSGDHLLRRTLPHLGLYFNAPSASGVKGGRFKALPAYLDSLDKVATLDIDRVYPGHGPAFGGVPQAIAWLRRQHEVRLSQTMELLKRGSATAFELLPQLFPRLRPAHWRLGLGQVIGCLDELEARGWVSEQRRERERSFQATESSI